MNIKEENIPNFTLSVSTLDSYLEEHMSNQNREVLDILENLENKNLIDLYKTLLFCIFHKEVPFRKTLCAHCIREFFNVIVRRNQKKFDIAKKEIYMDLCKSPSIKNEKEITPQLIEDAIKIDIDKLFRASYHFKIASYLKSYRPKLTQKEIELYTDNVLKAKEELERLRHFNNNGTPDSMSEDDFLRCISDFECFLLQMKESFLEQKDMIDDILEKANNG